MRAGIELRAALPPPHAADGGFWTFPSFGRNPSRPMLLSRFHEFERQLKARGWTYDTNREVFLNRLCEVLPRDSLLKLLPEMTWDELASYKDVRYDQLRSNRP